ncbi:MAG TPA: multicopper oxidase [Terriglobales bacterium]|jgi:spore coat protein A|nr:multicopper oxidase [Terriglobales bacterium]
MGLSAGAGLLAAPRRLLAQAAMQGMNMPGTNPQVAAGPPAQPSPPPVALASYVTPLAIPSVISPRPGAPPVQIHMRPFRHQAHRDLPPTPMWGYNGMWPGPTFEVRKGQPISVKWTNQLPTKHFLPLDYTIHGEGQDVPEVRTVTHVHGARVMPDSDGYPDAWVTSDGRSGSVRAADPCRYPNDQNATTLWYHDHSLGITRLNVYAGLAGFYIIRDPEEDKFNLPSGSYEIPLIIQDRSFSADGTLLYPPAPNGTHPVWMQEFFGNAICVNGKATPFLEVEPRKYRFRMVNGSNSRFYHLTLVPADASGKPNGKPADAPFFIQVGSDGGLLPAPLRMHYLIFSPGERFDIVIDFSEHKGANLAMTNNAPAPYARGGEIVPSDVMLFKVTKPLSGSDISTVPETLVPFTPLEAAHAVRERTLTLTEMDRPSDGYTMIGLLGQKHWDDPITEDPKAGSMEIWSFANTTGDVHPMHIHLVQFQVLNRQTFDVKNYMQTGKLVFTGIPMPPESNERPAWKDTVKTYSGYVTRVIARFDLPAGTQAKPGEEFRYVWHCHVLEHEDNEMMRPYKIIG